MRKLWRHWYGKLLVFLPLVLIVLGAASLVAASYTERSSFCVTACHEMAPYGATWKTSVHQNVPCVKCHIKPGAVELVKAKGSALREVYVHITGEVKAPIAVTNHVPDSTCQLSGCHPQGTVSNNLVLRGTTPPAGSGPDASTLGTSAQIAAAVLPFTAFTVAAASGTSPGLQPGLPAPPVVFSHEKHTKVPLCIECHARAVHRVVPGKSYVDPTSMAFCLRCHDGKRAPNTCETCHSPPHGTRGACSDCHTSGTWATDFKHPVAIGAQHRKLVCGQCHTQSSPDTMGFAAGCVTCHAKRHKTVTNVLCGRCHVPTHFAPSTFKHPDSGCETCHAPPHPERGACLRCHSLKSWANRLAHPLRLAGPHTSFVCEKCHTRGFNAPGLNCDSCHNPPHSSYGSCLKCHTMTSFAARFAHPFTLAGRHTTFVCEKCHTRGISAPGVGCDSCHQRPHPYYGRCLDCHTMTSFATNFSHPVKLAGVHTTFVCTRCHVNGLRSPGVACTRCHGSNHGGLTNCATCHSQAGWSPSTFRHPDPNMGGWRSMACSQCHPGNQFAKVYCSCHGGKVPTGD